LIFKIYILFIIIIIIYSEKSTVDSLPG